MYNSKLTGILFILFLSLTNSSKFLSQNKLRSLNEVPEYKRSAGILMHITSLPSNYGIGTLGAEAFKFADFLAKSKQKNWQMLPLGPTVWGDSPYSSVSSYAGNPYMIDLDILIEEGLLQKVEANGFFWGKDKTKVNFEIMFNKRYKVLEKAFNRFKPDSKYKDFEKKNQHWLEDYALFMAIRESFNYKSWTSWPNDIKFRQKAVIDNYKIMLIRKINLHKFIQYKFFEQFNKLKDYCHQKGIKLIGDVPIYVPLDSADVWSNPEVFQLDQSTLKPIAVAGVPPDYFSVDGQLWGNPLYDWVKMKNDNYKWFINRLRATGELFDVIRIDHFRGLESYWSVPYGEKTARNGKWVKGPGMELINAIHKELPDIDFIAEDLGLLTPEVLKLRDDSGFPGMKVLQFAFDSKSESYYLPHNHIRNSVCYAGTHDNEILNKWSLFIPQDDRAFLERYLGLEKGANLRLPILRAGMASISYLFIAMMQDYLCCAGEARMNRPGTNDGKNWLWRAVPGQINDNVAKEIAELTELYSRD